MNQQDTPGFRPDNQSGAGSGTGATDEVRQQTRETAQKLENRAREKGEEIRERVERTGEAQKERAAGTAEALAEAVRAAGSTLRDRDEDRLGQYTEEFADQIERFSGYLRDRDVGGLMHDLEDMARRSPTAFLGSSLAAGLVAGRFLRASDRSDTSSRDSMSSHAGRMSTSQDGRDSVDRHRPPSHQEFASNSPTPELNTPREAAGSSSPERSTSFGGETSNRGGGAL